MKSLSALLVVVALSGFCLANFDLANTVMAAEITGTFYIMYADPINGTGKLFTVYRLYSEGRQYEFVLPPGNISARNVPFPADKTVTLTPVPNGNYIIDPAQASATVTIMADPTVSVSATVPNASGSPGTAGQFTLYREGEDMSWPVIVEYRIT
jgi:hypothetical protein